MAKANEEFGDLVRSAIMEARKIGETSEKMSIAAINDRADITQVVTAVAEAEMTLQTVVNVRDKVLEAYNDIIRMPV
ncbi:MAG TPA: flagellar hook-basal body complex protein FliE [Rhodospirillaceae bacterium]|nr:flagellar hook-basal body complex protein FliE [Magnetovibrio sp.]HBT42107.1 flagellar hook-basal body complex protein FliE [Rhodospirillaceae bacterium]HCS70769.1 flagellar hook-basal body complex protein FliE [Rhodospirillaceae bacterium]